MQKGLAGTFLYLVWSWIIRMAQTRSWRCYYKYKDVCLPLVAHQVLGSLQLHRGWADRFASGLLQEQQALSGAVNKVAVVAKWYSAESRAVLLFLPHLCSQTLSCTIFMLRVVESLELERLPELYWYVFTTGWQWSFSALLFFFFNLAEKKAC